MLDYNNLIDKYSSKLIKDSSSRVFAPLGEIYRKLGMYDKALAVYESGVKLNPDYNLGLIGLAQCFFDLEQYQRAYNILKPCFRVSTENFRFLHLFAETCERLNLLSEALEAYKIALFINPRDKKAASFVGSYEDSQLQSNEVVIPATFAVDELDDDLDGWNQLSLVEQKEIVSEQSEENHSPSEDPALPVFENTGPVFSHTLVDLYIKQGAKEKAVEILEKALMASPSDDAIKEKLTLLKEEIIKSSGHEDLMAAFDNQTKISKAKSKDDVEKVRMAFDIFLAQINKRSFSVLNS